MKEYKASDIMDILNERLDGFSDEELQAFSDEVKKIVGNLDDFVMIMDPNGILELMRPDYQVSYPDHALALNCFAENASFEIH